ncbi:Oral-facial-digital syndrome 1 protein-like [Hondaea fermentalgiana]|uniref:Oral-facial-digital syndrome 1 protein-like n=1 Tax=Hondaea fermentalgiana TaxID=2315210 RepID=A0A2R5GSH1_9STRA|nr:Oral-facial-digital syndrome 1 protein-like [Hondaea fermentalgiana]|eukprot:GBG33826.1 Oral-facial-digital syndrome 1 protein-like [Hondaea fermentalgiana]
MRRSGRVRGARATSSGAGVGRATAAPPSSGNASPDESWSAEALKNSLFESLRRAGTVEALKAQLRAQVVDKLQGEDASLLTRSRETARGGAHDAEEPEDDLEVHVLQSLVADYLESRGCAYTLSVFMPEDGLGERAPLSRAELCRILSHVEEARPSDDEGQARYKDSGTQTADTERFEGDTAVTVLDRKLSRVNEQYVLQLEREALVPRRSEEERLIRYQRDCDQRAAEHIQSELARFRESELSAMRLQERAAMRRELTRERESARNELQARLAQLAERERALEDSLRRSQAQVEAALYDERQKLLHRFEAADVKTAQERREIGIDRKALKQSQLETDKLKAELERKLLEIHTLELDLKRRHDDDVRTYRQSVLADYEERERRVQREELRIREESAALARAKDTHAAQVEAASTVFDDLEAARAALELRTQERDDARVKVRALDEQMTFLKEAAQTERERHDRVHAASIEQTRELESLRSRMQLVEGSDLIKEKQRLVDDLRNQLHELREESSTRINKLETENAALSREKIHLERELHEVLEHAEGHQQQQIADINDALLEAREEAEAFRVKFEAARAGSRTLETENADLRRLLSQARRALDEEIANPKSYEDPPTPGPPRPPPTPRTSVVPAMPPVAPMAPMHTYTPMQIPFLPYATAAPQPPLPLKLREEEEIKEEEEEEE